LNVSNVNNQVTQSQSVPKALTELHFEGNKLLILHSRQTNRILTQKQSFKLKTPSQQTALFPNRQVANQMTNTRMGTRRTTIHSKLTLNYR
jgi:hypothetical protein